MWAASARFIAGISLSAIGAALVRITEDRTEQPVAMMPVLFWVQQLTEAAGCPRSSRQ